MNETGFGCNECERNAVGLVKVSGTTLYLCQSHYRQAIREYAEELSEKRLLPTGNTGEL